MRSPVALPVGNEKIGQILATIGSEHPGNIYEFSWLGGWFNADASVAGAPASDSYLFDLFRTDGTLLDQVLLDASNNFTATLALELAAGDYDIGLVCQVCSDPQMTISFNTPVGGVSGAVSGVPEPSSLAVIESGLLLMMLLGWRYLRVD